MNEENTHLFLAVLKEKIGLLPKDIQLYQESLTHRSYLNESKNKNLKSFERMEFLGDVIISFFVSHQIYQMFPHLPEGDLTNLRSAVVKTESLASLAKNLNLGNFVYLSKGEVESGGKESISLLADLFEAITAAIFLDQGIDMVNKFLQVLLLPQINNCYEQKQLKDYKSLLQEKGQEKWGTAPFYKVENISGPDHKRIYTIATIINSQVLGTGIGNSKQKAEQEAARLALEKLSK